jgi:hypothetical protein
MAESNKKLTPSGALRSGYDYQDIVAMDILVDWLEHEDKYVWIKVEVDGAGYLDDVVVKLSDGRVDGKQVKYSNHPNDVDDPWTWENLLAEGEEPGKTAKRSLLQKWANSIPMLKAFGDVREAAVLSNRRFGTDLQQSLRAGSKTIFDLANIPRESVRTEVITQLGGRVEAETFLLNFQFFFNEPNLVELEKGIKERFERLGGSELGWHNLKTALSQWAYYRNEPVPRGEIILSDIKLAALWEQTTGALSAIPLTSRPLVDLPLIGRSEVVDWLESSTGDRLLDGIPGSGKTFVFCKYRQTADRFFVIDDDRSRMLSALRARRPKAVIVDDAHLRLDTLAHLRQLRNETGLTFDIIASSWPGEADRVKEAIGIADSQTRTLGLLTRDEIAAVIRAAGLSGPDPLIQEIVEQADGRPGLAVTLTLLCLDGDLGDVTLGNALSRSIKSALEPQVGAIATEILAAFAVGGDAGMDKSHVASLMQMPLPELRRRIVTLAAGGVINETSGELLSVRPRELRYALIRDVFYSGGFALDIEPYIDAAPNLIDVIRTLLGVRGHGGAVPDEFLWSCLDVLDDRGLWRTYASLGNKETIRVLELRPDLAISVADPALWNAPEAALPLLLTAAIGDNRPLNAHPEHPFRQIEDWVKEYAPGYVERRRTLVRAVQQWLVAGGSSETGTQALAYAMTPAIEHNGQSPGSGNVFYIRKSVLNMQSIHAMAGVWNEVKGVLRTAEPLHWESLISMAGEWSYPQLPNADTSMSDVYSAMRAQAIEIVRGLLELAGSQVGLTARLAQILVYLTGRESPPQDPEFSILFPLRVSGDWEESEKAQRAAVRVLAASWMTLSADDVARRIVRHEEAARVAQLKWPRWTPDLCQDIAEQVDSPVSWAYDFDNVGTPGDLVAVFVERAIEVGEPGAQELVLHCLRTDRLGGLGIRLALTMENPPLVVTEVAWPLFALRPDIVELACQRNQVSTDLITRLLSHDAIPVRAATAVGTWLAAPRGAIPPLMQKDWREAIMASLPQASHDTYWLCQILGSDHSLARDWLAAYLISENCRYIYRHETTLVPVFMVLDDADRVTLLSNLDDRAANIEAIGLIIGNSVEAYRCLLSNETLKDYHLVPLGTTRSYPDSTRVIRQYHHDVAWNEMVAKAFDAGYTVEDVFEAAIPMCWSWTGNTSEMWQSWINEFAMLQLHADEKVRAVGALGVDFATEQRDRSLASERHYEVFGERQRF